MEVVNGIKLEDLEYLDIILNDNLQELNYQFRDSKYIEKLKNITLEKFSYEILREMKIKRVSCKTINQTNLEEISKNVFTKLKYLNQLHITHNVDLKILPASVFDLLKDNFILDLTISYNLLESLNSNVFNNFINLTFLSLSNNHLKNLPDKIFDNLEKLEILDLAYNKLQDLSQNVFDKLKSLKYLYLQFRTNLIEESNLIVYVCCTNQEIKKLHEPIRLGLNSYHHDFNQIHF